jgi:uncharacterized damage-inducible protein DinB
MQTAPVTPDYVRFLFDYSYWARDRVLVQTAKLDEREYVRARNLPSGSLRGTLVHLLSAEIVWRNRWQGVSPRSLLTEADVSTFDALRQIWSIEEAKMRAFLDGLTAEALASDLTYYSTLADREYTQPLWQLMVHVVNHGAQHRAEAALVLTDLGLSPGDLDMIVYLRQNLDAY